MSQTKCTPRHAAPVAPASHEHGGGAGRIVLAVVASLVAIVAVVYLAGVAAFSFFFMPNTTLDGRDVSLKLADDESTSFANKVGSYQVQVSGQGLDFALKGADIGLTFDKAAYRKSIMSQQDPWTWPLHVTESHALTARVNATYDADKLNQLLSGIVGEFNKTATQPQNASITFDDATQSYTVKVQEPGTAIDADALVSQVGGAVTTLPARIVPTSEALVQPAVTEDDENLKTAASNANKYLTADIPLTLGGQAAGEVTKAQISQWVVLGDDLTAKLDQTKMAAWAKDNIGKLDTVTKTRTYTRADGKAVTVEDSGKGNYGWVTDEASFVTALAQAIEAGSTATLEIPTKQTAAQVPDAGGRDWGNRYIDIDLAEQHVRMYGDDGSIIWESDAVTGDHAKGHDTPTGVFQINSNRATGNVELRGQIDPATNEPEYISHVDYWMPFIGNSWALHDADWRSRFGGNIYLTNGSHGCVNLPPDKAAALYNLCKVGDVVVVHY